MPKPSTSFLKACLDKERNEIYQFCSGNDIYWKKNKLKKTQLENPIVMVRIWDFTNFSLKMGWQEQKKMKEGRELETMGIKMVEEDENGEREGEHGRWVG